MKEFFEIADISAVFTGLSLLVAISAICLYQIGKDIADGYKLKGDNNK